MKKTLRLNIGCGETKLKGFINIDTEKQVKPDMLMDVTKGQMPFKDGCVSQINCIHNLEHIEFAKWDNVIREFFRVMTFDGILIIAYPEFEVCVKYFLTNHHNEKDFWRKTLYGRQLYPGDYHVTPMVTKDIITFLSQRGFDKFQHHPEVGDEYNTFLKCVKVKDLTKEDVLRREVFGKK